MKDRPGVVGPGMLDPLVQMCRQRHALGRCQLLFEFRQAPIVPYAKVAAQYAIDQSPGPGLAGGTQRGNRLVHGGVIRHAHVDDLVKPRHQQEMDHPVLPADGL